MSRHQEALRALSTSFPLYEDQIQQVYYTVFLTIELNPSWSHKLSDGIIRWDKKKCLLFSVQLDERLTYPTLDLGE